MVGENSPPSVFLKEKGRSVKWDVSKVLFPDIGKITNRVLLMDEYLLNKNKNFNKNETVSKMKIPKHSFREMNLLLQLV